jgi:short-subunit dehydrogenase
MTTFDLRGQTILITGASAGIGAEFARRLAARGAHLVLVARRAGRLDELAAAIRAEFGVTVTSLPFDLGRPGIGQALSLELAGRGIEITGIVNNAGIGSYGPFHDEDPSWVDAEIALNITALVDISRVFIDRLRAADAGLLINVASMAAYQPSPKMAVYAATKAFVLSFTEALWYESRGTGLRVLALSPGATETEFFQVAGSDDADGGTRRESPSQVVDVALAALDARVSRPSVISGRRNRVAVALSRLVSRRRVLLLIGRLGDRTRPAN